MTHPYRITGSLCPSFDPVRLVSLTVKHPCAITLYVRLPSVLRVPLEASVTLLEATTPVKLPTTQCPPHSGVRLQLYIGWYFTNDSSRPSGPPSKSPTYPTQYITKTNVKL